MKKINIFLASSNELKSERNQFEIEIYRKGKAWFEKNIFINLIIWEDLSGAMSYNRSQDKYNKLIRESDLFVLIAYTKMGKYSEEEFETAYKQFRETDKPKIFTYFKQTDNEDESLSRFRDYLIKMEHFFTYFSHFDVLWNFFNKELEMLNLNEVVQHNPVQDNSNILVFNAHLTRELTKAVATYNIDAQQLIEQDGIPGWELKPDISDTAKEIIVYSYVGALGIQLSRIMSIGNDRSDTKIKKYVENCLIMARKTMQTISFILLSELWNRKKSNVQEVKLSAEDRRVISRFFTSLREFGVNDHFILFSCLQNVFRINGLKCAVEPLNVMLHEPESNNSLKSACEKIELIDDLLRHEQLSLWDCQEVEVLLTQILVSFSFLTAYKMESIRRIEHEITHHGEPCFLHKYIGISIGNETKASVNDAMKFKSVMLKNDAVLFYKDRYSECVNMFPFIVDMNALNNEPGVNIGFFSSKMHNSLSQLRYRYLSDNIIREIDYKHIPRPDFNKNDEFIVTTEELKQLKLDSIYLQFNEAMDQILN